MCHKKTTLFFQPPLGNPPLSSPENPPPTPPSPPRKAPPFPPLPTEIRVSDQGQKGNF